MKEAFEVWENLGSREMRDYRIFSVHENLRRGPHGKEGAFVTIQAPDWAIVIPLVEREGQRFLLSVSQFRHGTERVYHEFPGGVIEPGEAPADAARRELLEETGCEASSFELLGSFSPNPAIMANTQYVFFASGLSKVSEQKLDEHEFVHVSEIPEREMLEKLGNGDWGHALMAASALLYARKFGLLRA